MTTKQLTLPFDEPRKLKDTYDPQYWETRIDSRSFANQIRAEEDEKILKALAESYG